MALPEASHSSNKNYVPILLRNILLYGNYFLITGYDFKNYISRRHVFLNNQVDWREGLKICYYVERVLSLFKIAHFHAVH